METETVKVRETSADLDLVNALRKFVENGVLNTAVINERDYVLNLRIVITPFGHVQLQSSDSNKSPHALSVDSTIVQHLYAVLSKRFIPLVGRGVAMGATITNE